MPPLHTVTHPCTRSLTGMVLGNTISGISIGLATVIQELSAGAAL
jgi:hypothetical protein